MITRLEPGLSAGADLVSWAKSSMASFQPCGSVRNWPNDWTRAMGERLDLAADVMRSDAARGGPAGLCQPPGQTTCMALPIRGPGARKMKKPSAITADDHAGRRAMPLAAGGRQGHRAESPLGAG